MELKEYRKELRRLSRTELLELMIEQSKELDRVRQELAIARAQLNDREIRLRQAGSIAEASLALGKVFEAAQAAADEYLKSVRMQGICSDEDWERILDEAIARKETDDLQSHRAERKNRRSRLKVRIVSPRGLKAEARAEEARLTDAETPAGIQTTEARYSDAAETAAETTYYNDEETEPGAVTVSEAAVSDSYEETQDAAEITETETGSEHYYKADAETGAVTVNEDADSVLYEETQDAAEITETVEGSAETATQATTESTETVREETTTESTETAAEETATELSETVTEETATELSETVTEKTATELSQTGIEAAAAHAAKETTEDAAETDLQEEPSEGELIERDTGTGIE